MKSMSGYKAPAYSHLLRPLESPVFRRFCYTQEGDLYTANHVTIGNRNLFMTTFATPRLIADFDLTLRPANNRRTYTDAFLLAQLIACAERLGSSPTMDEFNADASTSVHAHTLIDRFGSWNAAKRRAGLSVNRFATDEELLGSLKALAAQIGRAPSSREVEAARPLTASPSTYAHHFGSLKGALKAAGIDVAITVDEQLEAAIRAGVRAASRLGYVPSRTEWTQLRESDLSLPTEWQVYRLCRNDRMSAWRTFTALVEDSLAQA